MSRVDEDLARVRAVVRARLGLALEELRLDDLQRLIEARVARTGAGSVDGYAALLEGARGDDELRALAERVTVGETYFYRNPAQVQAYAEVMLPARAAAAGQGELRVLSAGCASGEEAYTLALVARDALPARGVSVVGVDVNPAAIARARRAAYTEWSLRQVAPDVRAREFRRVGRELQLRDETRALVSFEELNLTRDDPAFWRPARFDVVFFRNVGMYLEAAAYHEVIARLARALAPGGFLVLGDAETLRGVSTEFDLLHTHGAFYYQRRGVERRAAPAVAAHGACLAAPAATTTPSDDRAWFTTIADASARIAGLAARSTPTASPERWDLTPVRELVRLERPDAALVALDALPAAARLDPEVLLLQAVVLVNRGRAVQAAAACDELLAIDGLDARAHYVRALCAEHTGALAAAAEHDRTASHLDPTFVMPRLHLGLLASRAGRHDDARREFARALDLLPGEDDARLALFGGGFTREALASLCRGELRRLGGAP